MSEAGLEILYAADQDGLYATRQQLARRAKSGRAIRVAVGAYVEASDWGALDSRQRYLLRVRAVAQTRRRRPVLSHWSAAALHGLPVIGSWPDAVHITVPASSGARSRNAVRRHVLTLGEDDIVEVDGLLVTSVCRTVLDIAADADFRRAVVVADRAIHVDRFHRHPPLTTEEELWKGWAHRLPFRGHARARAVIEFAEPHADSPLETVSRVTMKLIGCPRARLQTRYSDDAGLIGDVDFDWPEFGVVGEADGESKYLDEALRSGRSAEQVVLDEKLREDRLRALPKVVARWGWRTASDPAALRATLVHAGLPMGHVW